MKQTAVEWIHELSKQREPDKFDWIRAKEIEKEQIIEAWIVSDNPLQRMEAEKYYSITYKQD